jgi:hypothetical protein
MTPFPLAGKAFPSLFCRSVRRNQPKSGRDSYLLGQSRPKKMWIANESGPPSVKTRRPCVLLVRVDVAPLRNTMRFYNAHSGPGRALRRYVPSAPPAIPANPAVPKRLAVRPLPKTPKKPAPRPTPPPRPTSASRPIAELAPNGGGQLKQCPRCGSTRLHLVKSGGPHFGRLDCLDCGLRGSSVAAPWTIERARAFTMPYGRHEGRTLGELAQTGEGRSYLEWVAATIKGNAGIAARIVLEGGVVT